MKEIPIPIIQEAVLKWYQKHGRHDLPWRNPKDNHVERAYAVLVSEFMLQQTQVERVVPKFLAFIKQFPTIQSLAESETAPVLALWSGLGYNRRALLLHKAAQYTVSEFDGVLPDKVDMLRKIPGIGPYTAGAIASFAYNDPVVVLDTNILRFYELLFWGHERPSEAGIAALATAFIPKQTSGIWHSAVMDLISVIRKIRSTKGQQEALLDALALVPTWKLPDVRHSPLRRPKQSTFTHSKRFYRGRIIAYLSEAPNHCANKLTLDGLMVKHRIPEAYSLDDILQQLRKDGLVTFSDPIENESVISLP